MLCLGIAIEPFIDAEVEAGIIPLDYSNLSKMKRFETRKSFNVKWDFGT